MNKKISIASALVVITLIAAIGMVSIQNLNSVGINQSTSQDAPGNEQVQTVQQNLDTLLPPGEPIKQLGHIKKLNDLSEIQSVKGFDVKIQKDLPDSYRVQYIGAGVSGDYVNVFISKQPITDETTDMGFVYGGDGVLVTITKLDPKVHTKENLYNKLAFFNPISVQIGNHEGFGNDIFVQDSDGDGIESRSPAQLNYNKGNQNIFLIGMVPLDTLVKIAESL